jgi:hypothetical protein
LIIFVARFEGEKTGNVCPERLPVWVEGGGQEEQPPHPLKAAHQSFQILMGFLKNT